MKLKEFYNMGYWEVRCSKNYAFLCCPIMEGLLTFKEKRLIYQQLKILERTLKTQGKSEVVCYTGLKNEHIMRMLAKMKYSPFYISLKKNILWFKKELKNV